MKFYLSDDKILQTDLCVPLKNYKIIYWMIFKNILNNLLKTFVFTSKKSVIQENPQFSWQQWVLMNLIFICWTLLKRERYFRIYTHDATHFHPIYQYMKTHLSNIIKSLRLCNKLFWITLKFIVNCKSRFCNSCECKICCKIKFFNANSQIYIKHAKHSTWLNFWFIVNLFYNNSI